MLGERSRIWTIRPRASAVGHDAAEFTPGAEDDLVRLYDFLLDRAETLEELDVADEAVKIIRQAALSHLSTTPSK